jgi:hypothetical protein
MKSGLRQYLFGLSFSEGSGAVAGMASHTVLWQFIGRVLTGMSVTNCPHTNTVL